MGIAKKKRKGRGTRTRTHTHGNVLVPSSVLSRVYTSRQQLQDSLRHDRQKECSIKPGSCCSCSVVHLHSCKQSPTYQVVVELSVHRPALYCSAPTYQCSETQGSFERNRHVCSHPDPQLSLKVQWPRHEPNRVEPCIKSI